MSLGFRRRILLLSLLFITLVDMSVGLYLEAQLRGSLEQRFTDELRRDVRSMEAVLDGVAPGVPRPAEARARLDPITDRFGAALETRVSVIGPVGNLLADSEVALEDLKGADDHSQRSEVIAARDGELGIARRHSATIGTDMLYVAERIGDGSERVVRVAVPLAQIDAAVWQLRLTLLLAGLVALGAAGILAVFASRLLSRSLQQLVATAQDEAGTLLDGGSPEEEPTSVNALADDLRRTVRLLGNERARFETVLETMGQAVLALDADGRVYTVNGAARTLLGLPQGVEGRTLLDFARVPALSGLVEDAARLGSASAEFDYGVSPRRRIEADATLPRQGGGTVIVMHDVTDLRRLETVRKDFIANVSHELRTPVAVIQANAETLMAGAIHEPKQAMVFLDALARHADRMGRLVADLLDISRIEAGRYTLDQIPVDVVEQVERVVAALALPAEDKGTVLVSQLEGELWVAADDKALEQVLFNLISNAIKYTQQEGHVEIGIRASDEESEPEATVRIEVRDDGPGIDPRHHHRVFERFYRVDPGRTRDMGGTGLGLAIVKHLVEAMGGQVGVDARRPRGSVFWFSVPTAMAALGDDHDDAAEHDDPDELAEHDDSAERDDPDDSAAHDDWVAHDDSDERAEHDDSDESA